MENFLILVGSILFSLLLFGVLCIGDKKERLREEKDADLAILKTRYDLTLPTHLQEECSQLTK